LAERTRQRQGRDFNSVLDYLKNAESSLEGKHNMVGAGVINNVPLQIPIHDDESNKKSLLIKLDQAKDTVAEQDAENPNPVDGSEPPERRGLDRQ
jgi:hypothetical protein